MKYLDTQSSTTHLPLPDEYTCTSLNETVTGMSIIVMVLLDITQPWLKVQDFSGGQHKQLRHLHECKASSLYETNNSHNILLKIEISR